MVTGDNDLYCIETLKKIVIQIMEMKEVAEDNITNLLGEDIRKFTSKQLFNIDNLY